MIGLVPRSGQWSKKAGRGSQAHRVGVLALDPKYEGDHQALAVVRFRPDTRRYVLHAFTAKGQYLAADADVRDRRLAWGFEDPRLGKLRYTIRLTPDGRWFEEGFASRNGGPRRKFFAMTMKPSKPAAPR